MLTVTPFGRAKLQVFLLAGVLAGLALEIAAPAIPRIPGDGSRLVLKSPSMAFELVAGDELKAANWENCLASQHLQLDGEELSLDIGESPSEATRVRFHVSRVVEKRDDLHLAIELAATNARLSAVARYELDAKWPVMRKLVQIKNDGQEAVRVLTVRLGSYPIKGNIEAGERGTPVYLNGERWMGLAHPAGFVIVEDGQVILRHHPGAKLGPSGTIDCMEAVYGVAATGEARKSFVSYVRSRSRRVIRGHDRPYAMFESFGGKPDGNYNVDEKYLLLNLARLGEGQKASPAAFDFYNIEFWVDTKGDITGFDPQRFPNGFGNVRREIEKLGLKPGLWIDSGGLPGWTIGGNPAVKPCMTHADGTGEICRACEPINSMYVKGFLHHMKRNGVRLLKFDNLGPGCQFPVCNNPSHDHLPGPVYSLEAIHNGIIRFLGELDRECPDVFLMLYWGYHSPWWLLHADTYFDAGLGIEAASPTDWPVPYARSGVIQKLDQAQWRTVDTPWLGKDSLGVWLSNWPWNSCIGKSRWQEGVIMDLCRGSLLFQIWTDTDWLTPEERGQVADFVGLLKANPDCFGNSRFVVGDPSRNEPYGYCCTDGKRAFVALHNACWKDSVVELKLGPDWGLPEGQAWSLYRWWPGRAKIKGSFERQASVALRPYEIMLLELVPAGTPFSLNRSGEGEGEALVGKLEEPARAVQMTVQLPAAPVAQLIKWSVLEPTSAVSANSTELRIMKDQSILAGGEAVSGDRYTTKATTALKKITAIQLELLPDESLPGRGPGRAINGNFQLTDFRVEAARIGRPEQSVVVALKNAKADYSQESHGGWPVEFAIDGDAHTAWSIDPLEGEPHVAVFELAKPIESEDGTSLTVKLGQGERQHCIGRFRISVTDATPPVPLPFMYPGQATSAVIQATIPPTGGGTLVLWGGRNLDLLAAKLDGKPRQCDAVWSDQAYWKANWQAWRIRVDTASQARTLELSIQRRKDGAIGTQWMAYLLPE